MTPAPTPTRRRTRRTTLGPLPVAALAAVIAAGTLCAPAALRAQFSVRPVIVDFPAGAAATRVATVRNEAGAVRTFRVYAADYDRAPDGEHRFMAAGDHGRSCSQRLSVFPEEITVDPGASVQVRITMEPGPRTCWSLVFFETTEGGAGGVRIGQRVGVKVYGTGPDARRDARLDSVRASPTAAGARVSFDVVNTGERVVRPTGEVEIRDMEGDVAATGRLGALSVLPGRTRRVEVSVNGELAQGRYVAVPLLDIGADYLVGGQAGLRVPPDAQAVAAGGG